MIKYYNRQEAVQYASRYAYDYNENYYNYKNIGGDCTNFASQCLFAGAKVMNYHYNGWYYINANKKSSSWTGVENFYQFLISNKITGPFGKLIDIKDIDLGDFIQLYDGKKYYHTLVVVDYDEIDTYVAAHTLDVYYKPLSTYSYQNIRCIKILGVRF